VNGIRRDRLRVRIAPDRTEMGTAAAGYVADRLRAQLAPGGRARVAFAAAASQVEFLDALASAPGIDWARVEAVQLDEYIGLPLGHRRSFGRWLDDHIWSRVRPGRIERMDGGAPDPEAECGRYGSLVADRGIDLALLGIGENGHLAFNDPHAADFADPLVVKVVELDEVALNQQVRDGAFPSLELVPRRAITLTMSTILASRAISVVVPGPQKAPAVRAALDGPIGPACPASALRTHPDAVLFLDEGAASQLGAG
jgi:glucosamine-6-phosphate deaminase